ncbi:MAG: RNA degradosome polyphosphate kinase [Candidatus Eremiobacterota bacterium]
MVSAQGPEVPERLFNRELSWLSFNERVLDIAWDPRTPLFERLRFLSISDANLDELFMVRVASLLGHLEAGGNAATPDGLTLEEQLTAIRRETRGVMQRQQSLWKLLRRELSEAGTRIVSARDLVKRERQWLANHFTTQILPVLTPLAVDPAHPFPLIPNDGLCFVLKLREGHEVTWELVLLPQKMPRFIALMGEKGRYLPLEEAVPLFWDVLLPNFEVDQYALFHVLRDHEMEMEVLEQDSDLLEAFRAALRGRARASVVRLTVPRDVNPELREFLVEALEIAPHQCYELAGVLNIGAVTELIEGRPDLLFPRFEGRYPERIQLCGGDYFLALKDRDLLMHHPYESFDVVVEFLNQAARDPDVVAIKQTLYRTTRDSPIVRALIEAAEAGKSVTAVVELKARFDEETNIQLAKALERAGAQVVYGFVDLKTHAKISLVLRREGSELAGYVHFGTGNYHPVTARLYSDLSLFTSKPAYCRDAAKVFNYITGYAIPDNLEHLSVSPPTLKRRLMGLIEEECEHARQGQPAGIWVKINALTDPEIIHRLYHASRAGVHIELIVRGVCCLKPGVPGLSENIRVKSIVGRFLEHSRVLCFGAGKPLPHAGARVFISSADWMRRNFQSRVETLVPVEDPDAHAELLKLLQANLADTDNSWLLQPDGSYERVEADSSRFDLHAHCMRPRSSHRSAETT